MKKNERTHLLDQREDLPELKTTWDYIILGEEILIQGFIGRIKYVVG